MSGLITGYDPKTQNFIDTDLFDVSKHVTQTSGVLEVGVEYTILDFNTGDNFTNVGGTNVTGNVFVATGTTPTTYTNGSTLAKYVTQSYTYADLKSELGLNYKKCIAYLTQSTPTSNPTVHEIDTTLSSTLPCARIGVGDYEFEITGEFPDADKIFIAGCVNQTGTSFTAIPIISSGGFSGYIQFSWKNVNKLSLKVFDSTTNPEDLKNLLTNGRFCLPEIRVYP